LRRQLFTNKNAGISALSQPRFHVQEVLYFPQPSLSLAAASFRSCNGHVRLKGCLQSLGQFLRICANARLGQGEGRAA